MVTSVAGAEEAIVVGVQGWELTPVDEGTPAGEVTGTTVLLSQGVVVGWPEPSVDGCQASELGH